MAAANTDFFTEVGNPGTATTLAAPGHTIAGTTFNVVSTTNYPTTTGAIFAVDTFTTQIVNGVSTAVRTPGSYTEWEGTVTNSTTISNATLRYGTDQNYSAGASTRVYIPVASSRENRLVQGIQVQHNQDGTHGAVTATSVVATGNITAANFIQTGGAGAAGWTVGLATPNTVTALGNRSYSMVFNGTDLTSTVSNGMRLRTTRTVAAPTQCTSLNGTTQYYSKTSPAGMTFIVSAVGVARIKITSYAAGVIQSRYNGTSGWQIYLDTSGRLNFYGFNAGASNNRGIVSTQSVPLNKWINVTAQIDMSTATLSPTTNYMMFDDVDVPITQTTAGTAPTTLIQAGDYQIGAANGGTFFPGKLAQVAIFGAKVTQAIMQSYTSQSFVGTETNLISAYSFNNTINDLNANANNLTANGSAVATNADSPFGGQADGTISSTLDYAIVQKSTFSTNTTVIIDVPEGCAIPTSGGVASVVYSSNKVPYNFPAASSGRWDVAAVYSSLIPATTITALNQWFPLTGQLNVPAGERVLSWAGTIQYASVTSVSNGNVLLAPATPTNNINTQELNAFMFNPTAQTNLIQTLARRSGASLASATTYLIYGSVSVNVGTTTGGIRGDLCLFVIKAENAYL